MTEVLHPIEGQVVLMAGAKASIPLPKLSELLGRIQEYLGGRLEEYEQRFERIDGSDNVVYYLAERSYWDDIGRELGLSEREVDAVRRTHEAQFERDGRRLGRAEEFETSLEIRDVLAVAPEET